MKDKEILMIGHLNYWNDNYYDYIFDAQNTTYVEHERKSNWV